MSAIPGEPHKAKPLELTLADGRKVRFTAPGLAAPIEPGSTEERGAAEPPRDDPRPAHDPNHIVP